MKIKRTTTNRGFRLVSFIDSYGYDCSIQESSNAEKACIWMGIRDERMHLSQSEVKKLIPILQGFVERGDLRKVRR